MSDLKLFSGNAKRRLLQPIIRCLSIGNSQLSPRGALPGHLICLLMNAADLLIATSDSRTGTFHRHATWLLLRSICSNNVNPMP